MLLLSAHFLVVVSEGKICCIQMELIFLSLEKLGGTIVYTLVVFFMINVFMQSPFWLTGEDY